MAVQDDLKAAYFEVGYPCTVEKVPGGELYSGEIVLLELNAQVTKPFIREFFLEGEMPFDTKVMAGDVVHISGESSYMVAHKTPEMILSEQINQSVVFYKANVSGELRRSSGEDWSAQEYRKTYQFGTVHSNVYGLITPTLFGTDLREEPIGLIDVKSLEMYLPSSYGAQPLDRYEPISGERYMVTTVQKYRYPAVDYLTLQEDTR